LINARTVVGHLKARSLPDTTCREPFASRLKESLMSQNRIPSARPEDIYRKLEGGLGHELVDDSNVDQLIQMAHQKGNATMEAILREWRADCEAPANSSDSHVKH
jgi:hypothetical protein